MRRRIVAFIRLSRFKFLAGGVAGGALGTFVARYVGASFDLRAFAIAQTTISAAHAMVHFANDYFDREGDARATPTEFSGGSGVLINGSLAPGVALVTAIGCATLAAFGVVALALIGRPFAALLALAMIALAWAYSAPPLRLAMRGLGELDTALVVAILVPLCAYAAQGAHVSARMLAATLPGACAIFVMMVCVELPDREADAACAKRNLVVRLGVRRAASIATIVLAAIPVAVILAVAAGAPPAYAMLQIPAIPALFDVARDMRALQSGEPIVVADLAARGVVLFMLVTTFGALGYSAGLR